MTLHAPSPLQEFQWERQPDAERLVRELVDAFLARNVFGRDLARRMTDDTGTRFHDWVETIAVPDDAALRQRMAAVGYERFRDRSGVQHERVWANPHGMFPRIVAANGPTTEVHIKVDSVADFADVWRLQEPIQGE